MYSKVTTDKYLTMLSFAVDQRRQNFTQEEMAQNLEISLGTIKTFENGSSIRFDILEQYVAMCSTMEWVSELKLKAKI